MTGKKAKLVGKVPSFTINSSKNLRRVLANDEIFQELEKMIKDGRNLSEIEFSICTDELKQLYIDITINNGKRVEDWIFDWCDETKKRKIITAYVVQNRRLTEQQLAKVPKDLIETYLTKRFEADDSLEDFEVAYLSEEKKKEIIHKMIEGECCEYLSIEQFMLADERHKLTFLINNGIYNLHTDIVNWYKTWYKAKGRDFKIDSVLFD